MSGRVKKGEEKSSTGADLVELERHYNLFIISFIIVYIFRSEAPL